MRKFRNKIMQNPELQESVECGMFDTKQSALGTNLYTNFHPAVAMDKNSELPSYAKFMLLYADKDFMSFLRSSSAGANGAIVYMEIEE